MGSWRYYLGPEAGLNLAEEGSRAVAYLSGASFLHFPFCSMQGPAPGAPTLAGPPHGQHSKNGITAPLV